MPRAKFDRENAAPEAEHDPAGETSDGVITGDLRLGAQQDGG
jgi:hypothetical protein